MEERQTLTQATKLWQEAYRHQMKGELDVAILSDHDGGRTEDCGT